MDKIVGKVKKQIEKAKIKRYFKKLIEILSLKELRILPAYLAYSFVLAVVPILTIIVIVAGFFSISIDSVISLLTVDSEVRRRSRTSATVILFYLLIIVISVHISVL